MVNCGTSERLTWRDEQAGWGQGGYSRPRPALHCSSSAARARVRACVCVCVCVFRPTQGMEDESD